MRQAQIKNERRESIGSDELPENSGSGFLKLVPVFSSELLPVCSMNPKSMIEYRCRFQRVPDADSGGENAGRAVFKPIMKLAIVPSVRIRFD